MKVYIIVRERTHDQNAPQEFVYCTNDPDDALMCMAEHSGKSYYLDCIIKEFPDTCNPETPNRPYSPLDPANPFYPYNPYSPTVTYTSTSRPVKTGETEKE
ncbi:MAG: hypothetical protein K6A41_04155 [Bacteroidales bacterium]|nr:hypothetical protein [Bacteroidales bacterium]